MTMVESRIDPKAAMRNQLADSLSHLARDLYIRSNGDSVTSDGDPPQAVATTEDLVEVAREVASELVDVANAAEMPFPRDVIKLTDYVPRDVERLLPEIVVERGIPDYCWYEEDHYEKALRWAEGYFAAKSAGLPSDFFSEAIVDIYHFDRAYRGHVVNKTSERPLRESEIPKHMDGLPLHHRKLAWSVKTPYWAVDAAAQFIRSTPPDSLWIAEYSEDSRSVDPIIYAHFGGWSVEIARWD